MADQNDNHDWREKQFDYGKYRFFYRILGGAVLVSIGVLIGWWLFSEKQVDYLLSLFTNLLSIFVTVFVLDLLAQRREERRERRQLKERLISELGSSVNEVAKRAAEELRGHGWLQDSTLRGQNLKRANLEDAMLFEADLQEIILMQGNLRKAHVGRANLEMAWLYMLEAQEVLLAGSNLYRANLQDANLAKAMLLGVNFRECNLFRTNMKNGNLWIDQNNRYECSGDPLPLTPSPLRWGGGVARSAAGVGIIEWVAT